MYFSREFIQGYSYAFRGVTAKRLGAAAVLALAVVGPGSVLLGLTRDEQATPQGETASSHAVDTLARKTTISPRSPTDEAVLPTIDRNSEAIYEIITGMALATAGSVGASVAISSYRTKLQNKQWLDKVRTNHFASQPSVIESNTYHDEDSLPGFDEIIDASLPQMRTNPKLQFPQS